MDLDAQRPRLLLACAVLLALVAFVFAGVVDHDFVDFDDRIYVADNPAVLDGLSLEGLRWSFTTGHAANWHPLTWLSHMLDISLFGPDPGAMARTNVVIHALSSVLLLLFFVRATGMFWPSLGIALLFAIHPVRVESVAWIAERKDVLAGLFFMLTLHGWLAYVRDPKPLRYALVALALMGGLLSKPTVVTLPFVLVLVDLWPLARWPEKSVMRLLAEKLPLFLLVLLSSAITLWIQSAGGAMREAELSPLDFRLANAITAYASYVGHFFWPAGLAAFYPLPLTDLPDSPWNGRVLIALVGLGGVTAWAWSQRMRRPWFGVGWCWFGGMLVPMIGLVQVGNQSMADRYLYVSAIGLSIPVVWGLWEVRGVAVRRAVFAATAVAILALAGVTTRQVSVWRNHETLFMHALTVTEGNYLAHYNIGTLLLRTSPAQTSKARPHLEEAVRLDPGHAGARLNLGAVEWFEGDLGAATRHFERAVALDANDPEGHLSLGSVRFEAGRVRESLAHFERAIELEPSNAKAHSNRATVLMNLGRRAEARAGFARALEFDPSNAAAQAGLEAASN